MFLGVVAFAGVVLFVLALAGRASPVPAGVDGSGGALLGSGTPLPRLAPSRLQATLSTIAFSLLVWSLFGIVTMRYSIPDGAGAAHVAELAARALHAVVAFGLLVTLPAYASTTAAQFMGYRANRGRARAHGMLGADSLLGGAYRALGRTTVLKIAATTSVYACAVWLVSRHIGP